MRLISENIEIVSSEFSLNLNENGGILQIEKPILNKSKANIKIALSTFSYNSQTPLVIKNIGAELKTAKFIQNKGKLGGALRHSLTYHIPS